MEWSNLTSSALLYSGGGGLKSYLERLAVIDPLAVTHPSVDTDINKNVLMWFRV